MSFQNSAKQKTFNKSATKIAGSLLVLTGFVASANNSGLFNQLTSNLDQLLMPAAQAKNVKTNHIAITDEQLSQKLGANSLIIDDKTVFIVNQVGEKTAAPSGYYKLSDGSILKVKDGQITDIAKSQLNSDGKVNPTLLAKRWRRVDIGRWRRVIRGNRMIQEKQKSNELNADIQQEVAKQNVHDTLNRILES